MKILFIIICWAGFFSSVVIGQNYAPFNANVSKRFYNVSDSIDNDYFFYSDSLNILGDITTWYQYYSYQSPSPTFDPTPCFGWGGGVWAVMDTTWLGIQIEYNNLNKQLILLNDYNDTLNFNFSIMPGDSSIFYQDSGNIYFMKYDFIQYESIYGYLDSVKTFTILHYDTAFTPVVSPLSGETIKLGKSLGLINFINTFNFPALEVSVQLQGQTNPLVGNYQLSYDQLYPFQIGDTLQYTKVASGNMGVFNCNARITTVVTNRVETPTDVTIYLDNLGEIISQNPPFPFYYCSTSGLYSTTIAFTKNVDLLGFPYNRYLNSPWPYMLYQNTSMDWLPGCGPVASLMSNEEPYIPCIDCHCYIAADGSGQYYDDVYFTPGFGVTKYYSWEYAPGMNISTIFLTYSSINGVQCGNYHHIGIELNEIDELIISPNPTEGYLQFNLNPDQVIIYNLRGEQLANHLQPGTGIDLSLLNPGIYFLDFIMGERHSFHKIVKIDP